MISYFFCGFILAALLPFIYKLGRGVSYASVVLYSFGLCLLFGEQLFFKGQLNQIIFSYPWFKEWGLYLSFHQNGFNLLFATLISFIGTFILSYSFSYFNKNEEEGRFLAVILLFKMSMLGVVLSNNLMLTFIFWELTGITSFLLIGYSHQVEIARENAKTALFVTGFGDLFFLAAIVLFFLDVKTLELNQIVSLDASSFKFFPWILGSLLIAAFTKSAQFPFHFWLPRAMVAPTPVSAFLHSATMVKAGIFLVIVFFPLIRQSIIALDFLIVIGSFTALLGAFSALFQTDLKRLLAFTTISSLGIIFALVGLGSDLGLQAGIVYILTHALFKSSLFMTVGSIDHHMHTRDLTHLSNLRKFLPLTSLVAFLAAISMLGLPPFVGYVSKHLFYKSAHEHSIFSLVALSLANLMMVSATLKYLLPFFKKSKETPHNKDLSLLLWICPFMIGLAGLIFGVFANSLTEMIINRSVLGVIGKPHPEILTLWHKPDRLLALSIVVFVLSYLLYRWTQNLTTKRMPFIDKAYNIYKKILNAIISFSGKFINNFQDGDYWKYIVIIMVFTIACLVPLVSQFRTPLYLNWEDVAPLDLAALFLMNASCLLAIRLKSRLGSVIASGGIGLGVTFIYALYGAPDLALTQMMVEILTLVLLVIAIRRLPIYRSHMNENKKIISLLVAGTLASFLALITLEALNLDVQPKISNFFSQNSYLLARGRNVVNVILVDFRGLDTLGEITVLCLAGLGVFSLLKSKKEKNELSDI